jgi:cell division protein FtsI/penicillin-binding protein 2
MASFPDYDPGKFYEFPSDYYKNPAVANLFEPGSIFKPLIMAAALDANVVKPETACDICRGPISVGTYTIGTWNGEYHPETSMTDTIIHSDNTGMVFAARKLGADKLHDYLAKFGLGEKTGIDLEEETTGVLKPAKDWREIDLATTSFGQGIALTPIQVAAAINALANGGVWVKPFIVRAITDQGRVIPTVDSKQRQVLGKDAVAGITQMMIAAVEQGEAKWFKPKNLSVAGKTGTAQIPVSGHYDAEKTIASFVGFSPSVNPKFTMLVSLREPQTSQWGSETAAPLWFDIAKQISLLL